MEDTILNKKLTGYRSNEDNFVAAGEITVTITLNEYRELVKIASTANDTIRKNLHEQTKLKSENEALKAEIADLKELYESMKGSDDGE